MFQWLEHSYKDDYWRHGSINEDYSKCTILPGVHSSFKLFREKGYKIYLHTGRHINNFDVTVKWLKKNKIDYDHLVLGKPVAKYYIDDRGINFSNWEDALKKIKL